MKYDNLLNRLSEFRRGPLSASNQTRTHNAQNQITSITGMTSPLHDGNG